MGTLIRSGWFPVFGSVWCFWWDLGAECILGYRLYMMGLGLHVACGFVGWGLWCRTGW